MIDETKITRPSSNATSRTWYVLEVWQQEPEKFDKLSEATITGLRSGAPWSVSIDGVSNLPSELVYWKGYFGSVENWKASLDRLKGLGL